MTTVVNTESIQIECHALGPFGTNSYIITDLKTSDSVVIDAPGDAPKVVDQLNSTSPKYILMTHNHMDHTGALAELKSTLKVPIAVHAADAARLPVPADRLLADGELITFGTIRQPLFLHRGLFDIR